MFHFLFGLIQTLKVFLNGRIQMFKKVNILSFSSVMFWCGVLGDGESVLSFLRRQPYFK